MLKIEELEPLIALLKKYGVADFEHDGLKIKLNNQPKAESKSKDISDLVPKLTPEQDAEQILFYSAR